MYMCVTMIGTWMIIFKYKYYFLNLYSKIYGVSFIFTYISEALVSFIWLSFFITIIIVLPILFYHIYQYLTPGLYTHELENLKGNMYLIICTLWSSILFNYFFFLPYFMGLLLRGNESNMVLFMPKISEFVSFILIFTVCMMIMWMIPIIMLKLMRRYEKVYERYVKNRIYIYFCMSCIISIWTPPELILVISAIIIFILFLEILIFLYCIGKNVA